ncbi:retrovirus-related pol polyprotein from transposon TNT 1-94 [Tanacetum coccineum]|uniref:Retrovirus-related pol polyprotein from transposon TNT 1-94 n=1 Tax=Tanacetum coccineum TaxID=301880 RepID=A0ABQ5GV77_9ASTR
MQVNVQFLQQLQPEWSRFVTVVKQSKEIDTISYHTLFDILKQYQNEVNDICAERITKSANPLALIAAAQPYLDNYYQAPKPQRSNATSSSTRPSASTRHKGKEIAKPVTPQSESVSKEDTLLTYHNNLRTSSNSRNKTEDTTPRYNNDNQSGQFGNQRTMTVAGTRETVGSLVVQQTGIHCFNCKGFGHYAKECKKPKRVKDYTHHKEKMMMCKQAEQGVPLQAEQVDWLADTDEEIDEQELEAHYSFMAKIQEVLPEESSSTEQPLGQVQNPDENNVFANERRHSEQPESINDTYVLEKDDSNVTLDSSNICNNDNQVDQNAAECVDERDVLANLIANLTLDIEENKTILKQLKKANASLTQELKECRTNLDETGRALGEATSCLDSCLISLQNKQNELEKYIAFNDRTIDYDILQTKLNETLGLLACKDIDIKEGLKTKAYEISVVSQKHDELVKRSLLTKSNFEGQLKEKSKVISDLKDKEEKDIDKMIEMDKQLKFLNEIVYTRNQSIQTIHMLAPKCSTYNGRPTFANPRYLKKAQSEKPCLYEIPYDTSDLVNKFGTNREETMTLANESRSKLNKDYVKPYDYTKQNSLYEIFKAPSLEYLYQLERAKEVRKTMWRKPFVRTKPNIAKNVAFLPVSKSISKSRQNFPKIRKQAVRNTNVIAPGPSRNHPKHLSFQSPKEFVGSNYMVHNYYLEKAKKSAQLQKDRDVNGKPSMINLLEVSKPANCANHDECVLEYLSKLNPRASAQNKDAKSHKTTKRYMPVEKTRESKRPERQIPSGHRFSKKKTTTVPEKTMTPRSCLSEPMHGSIVDNPHIHACKQTLSLSADLAPQRQEMSVENVTSGLILEFKTTSMEQSCSKAGSKSCSLSNQDSYITTSVGITIPPSHSNVEDNKWFRLESSYDPTRSGGIYRRISNVRKLQSLVMTSLIRVNTILQNHMMIAGIENDIMVPVIAMHNTFPGLLGVSQQITFVSFVSEYLRYLLTDQSRDR